MRKNTIKENAEVVLNDVADSPRENKHVDDILFKLLIIIVVVAIAAASWFYLQYSQIKKQSAASAQSGQEEAQRVISETVASASKLMLLPEKEVPQVAVIADPQTLAKQQAFYEGAEKGDRLLIYSQAKKAIIFSPARNIIVNAGPIYVNEQASDTAATSKTEKTLKTTATST